MYLKNNIHYREVQLTDAHELIRYLKIVMSETNYLRMYPDEVKYTIEEEESYIKSVLNQDNSTILLALDADLIVSVAGIHGQQFKKFRHIAEFGISVIKEYWGRGIGKEMTIRLINWSKKNPHLKKLVLHVNVENLIAINLYKQLGFKQEGLLINDFYYDGRYVDTLIMGMLL